MTASLLACTKCGKKQADEAFRSAPKNTRRRGLASWCNSCARAQARDYKRRNPQSPDPGYHRAYYRQVREDAIAALGGCCAHCGETNSLVLQFDHIVPKRRRGGANYSELRSVINGQVDVLQLLCANCHVLKTRTGDEFRKAV